MSNISTQIFLKKADEDLRLVENELTMPDNRLVMGICVFHCQQAVEKYFKAYLIYKGFSPPKVHDLEFLKKKCIKYDKEFDIFDVFELTQYAVEIRCSDEIFEPTKQELLEYLELVKEIREFVKSRIK